MVLNPFPAPSAARLDLPKMSVEEFVVFCEANPDVHCEREADGTITLMSPVTSLGGGFETLLLELLVVWNRSSGKKGVLFGSSTGFTLANTAVKSPDATWIGRDRWQTLSAKERRSFARIAPDFVAEIRSESDSLPMLLVKMDEYIANGVRLAWLIDPIDRRAYAYRPGQPAQQVDFTATLSGEQVLEGFTLVLAEFDEAHL